MTIGQVASLVAKGEGKKKQVSMGNIREVLKVLRLSCKDPAVACVVARYLLGGK